MMEKVSALNGIDFSPEINMARYLQKIRTYPILSQDEEYKLAVKYQQTKSNEIAKILVTSHLRLVVKVVSKYRGYGLSSAEMISEGNIGLLYAVEKFEPEKGFRFSTYALWWIKASVQKYILNSWSLVKIGTTAAQKKLFFNLRKIKNRLNLSDDRDLSPDILNKIAGSLDVSVQEVTDMNTRLKAHDGSLNTIVDTSNDSGAEWMDFIADSKPNQEEVLAYSDTMKYRKALFNKAVGVLNTREKDILFKRRLLDKAVTLDDLSKTYNISKERIRQIELNSIKKIRKAIEADI
ncbi:MAG: sigma-70 family RNA polymerase sigma factor [Alphaproteobacteria bacterium]|nr:sigma-70 family RNA polymerase sigma factor [Alphaproteobacteria bacterium]